VPTQARRDKKSIGGGKNVLSNCQVLSHIENFNKTIGERGGASVAEEICNDQGRSWEGTLPKQKNTDR